MTPQVVSLVPRPIFFFLGGGGGGGARARARGNRVCLHMRHIFMEFRENRILSLYYLYYGLS